MRPRWMVVIGLVSCGGNRNPVASDAHATTDARVVDAPAIVDANGILDAHVVPDTGSFDAAIDASSTMATITVSGFGDGTGTFTVNGSPCGAPCAVAVPVHTSVVVVATPDSDSFIDWNTCPSASGNTCTVVADFDETLLAQFYWPSLQVVPSTADGAGSISGPPGASCSGSCVVSAKPGTQLTFMATPDAGTHSALINWGLASCGSGASCTFTMQHQVGAIEYAYFGRDNSVDNGATTFTATKEGAPLWTVAGFKIASVYGYQLFALERLWDGHFFNSGANAFYPGTPHAGPYDTEAATRFTALGWDDGNHFPGVDWSSAAGRSLEFVGTIVPSAGAPRGSTKDYFMGPIIPRDLALYVDGDMYLDSTLIDPDFDQPYGTLADADPMSTEAGWSHMTLSLGENQTSIPGTPGSYRLHIHVYELATPGNGWQVDIPFVIDP